MAISTQDNAEILDRLTDLERRLDAVEKDSAPVPLQALPQGRSSRLDSDTVDGYQVTSAAAPSPNSIVPLGTNGKFGAGVIPYKSGASVQHVASFDGALATGTTTIPYDDTIPQNTEGTQFLSVAITPTSATNILVVEAIVCIGTNTAGRLTAAIFQDSTANALACAASVITASDFPTHVSVRYRMTAGTTSATTFKVRAGNNNASTYYFNGDGSTAARKFGGVYCSHIIVTEYQA